jgi:hypothetical protein
MDLNTYNGEVPISPYIIPNVTIKPATESLWACPLDVCAMKNLNWRTKFTKKYKQSVIRGKYFRNILNPQSNNLIPQN